MRRALLAVLILGATTVHAIQGLVPGTATNAQVGVDASVTQAGSCIGDASGDWCGTTNQSLGNPNWIMPNSASATPSAKGGYRFVETTVPRTVEIHDGVVLRRLYEGIPIGPVFGGTNYATAFTYGAQSSGCTGDICRAGSLGAAANGTCASSTCTLPVNTSFLRPAGFGAGVNGEYSYSSWTQTSGTVTIGASSYQILMIRVSGDMAITGGTITMNNLGAQAFSGGAACPGGNVAGGAGASSVWCTGGAGGSTAGGAGGNASTNFTPVANDLRAYYLLPIIGGGGAGGIPGFAGTGTQYPNYGFPLLNACGGGTGGCTGCSGKTFGAPGKGGGMLYFEVAGTYSCSGATISANGQTGGDGSGGGAGGGILIRARAYGTDTCTYTVTKGNGGSAPAGGSGTCGAGGNGLDGIIAKETYPQ